MILSVIRTQSCKEFEAFELNSKSTPRRCFNLHSQIYTRRKVFCPWITAFLLSLSKNVFIIVQTFQVQNGVLVRKQRVVVVFLLPLQQKIFIFESFFCCFFLNPSNIFKERHLWLASAYKHIYCKLVHNLLIGQNKKSFCTQELYVQSFFLCVPWTFVNWRFRTFSGFYTISAHKCLVSICSLYRK